jgi:hypothetical protein
VLAGQVQISADGVDGFLVALAVSLGGVGMWWGRGVVFTGLDGGVDAGEIGERRCVEFSG